MGLVVPSPVMTRQTVSMSCPAPERRNKETTAYDMGGGSFICRSSCGNSSAGIGTMHSCAGCRASKGRFPSTTLDERRVYSVVAVNGSRLVWWRQGIPDTGFLRSQDFPFVTTWQPCSIVNSISRRSPQRGFLSQQRVDRTHVPRDQSLLSR